MTSLIPAISRWYAEGSAGGCVGVGVCEQGPDKNYCRPGPAKIFLIARDFFRKKSGANVTGPEFFLRTGSAGIFFAGVTRCELMEALRVGRGRACGDHTDPGPV